MHNLGPSSTSVAAAATRLRGWTARDPWFVAVLVLGLLVRAALIPITHGNDFVVWDESSAATLRGVNIYAHPPAAISGPFAYFPLFIYLELPFQWLAQHTMLSFTVLGKLPILVGDLTAAVLIARELRERGATYRSAALGSAVFFLNPLVLYNSAYYGRFDTLGCALLLVAYRGMLREVTLSRRSAVYYACAVAMKTFPAFAFAGLVRTARGHRLRLVAILVAVLLGLSAPYLAQPRALVRQIVFWDAGKTPRGLSWQHVLLGPLGASGARALSYVLLVIFVVATIWLSRIRDLGVYIAVTLVLFVVCSKIVFEQYLIWPLPWLIALAWWPRAGAGRSRWAAAALIGVFTLAGLLDNESVHPFGRSPNIPDVLLALLALAFVIVVVHEMRSPSEHVHEPV